MSAGAHPAGSAHPPFSARSLLSESLLVVGAGVLLGLLANAVSPHGLTLGRDYFPKAPAPVLAAVVATNELPRTGSTPALTNALLARLRQQGLQPIEHAAVVALFHDPRRVQGQVIFVDARNDANYQAGHIPAAYQFDHYRPESYLAPVLMACAPAEQIVVYCTGGDCEDSEFAAVTLMQAGVPRERLFIYPGGFTEWSTNGLPQELGARLSGVLRGGGL